MRLCEALAERARRQPDAPALRVGAATTSLGEIWREAERRAVGFQSSGDTAVVPLDASEPSSFLARLFGARLACRAAVIHSVGIPQALRDRRERTLEGRVAPTDTVFYSSGSVGPGKGIPLDEDQLLFAALAYSEEGSARPMERIAVGVPLGHIYGFVRGVLHTWLHGAEVLPFSPRRDPLGEAGSLGASVVLLSAGQLTIAAKSGRPAPLRLALSGGARVPEAAARAIEEKRGVPLRLGYGLTETAGLGTRQPLGRPRRPGTSGRPAPGIRIEVALPDGGRAPAGESGEIRMAGPSIFRGYADASVSSPFDELGWLHTGDLGWLDEEGELVIRGRAETSIVSGGRVLCAEEVEAAALEVPGISDAAAVPLASSFGLLVVVADESPRFLEELRLRLSDGLPAWAQPRQVRRIEEIPRGPSGKPDREAASRCFGRT